MRLRGKTAIRALGIFSDEEDERRDHQRRVRRVLEQEGELMVQSGYEAMDVTYDVLRKIKQASIALDPDDVLRTRVVSVQELLSEVDLWRPAIENELKQLFDERGALVRLSEKEVRELRERHGQALEIIPMKPVLTKKPGPRRRFRLVACGNFVEKSEKELVYAGGADALALRYTLKRGAEENWHGMVVDIRVAFLHAPLVDSDADEPEPEVLLKPPPLLARLGYAGPKECYRADRAVYGLRQAPRCWGKYRDKKLRKMRTSQGHAFVPSDAEPNLWKIVFLTDDDVEDYDKGIFGLIVIYVDDLLVMTTEEIHRLVLEVIQAQWGTSDPEFLKDGAVKFLGMELSEHELGYFASQRSYIEDKKLAGTFKKGLRSPNVKEMYPGPEEGVTKEAIREAQRIVGELLWLATRTRPEIAFATSRCSQLVLTSPRWVIEMGETVWHYLKATADEGLWFFRSKGTNWCGFTPAGLETFSDISFAPMGDGTASQGCIFVRWNGSVMLWRSSRQPFPTLSTAEAELVEAVEGMTLGDSCDALIGEHEGNHHRLLLVDNQATVSLMTEGPTSWRTRHLRLRAQHLQWRLSSLDWKVSHIPGSHQLADIGTKPLLAQRLDELKAAMGMGSASGCSSKGSAVSIRVLKEGIRLAMFMNVFGTTEACGQHPEGSSGSPYAMELWFLLVIYTLAVIFVTVLVMECIGGLSRRSTRWMRFELGEEPWAPAEEASSSATGGVGEGAPASVTPAPTESYDAELSPEELPARFNVFGASIGDEGHASENLSLPLASEVPLDVPAREGERWWAAPRGVWSEPVGPLRHRRSYFLARTGVRYHVTETCTSLRTSRPRRASVCDLCRAQGHTNALFAQPDEGLLHVDEVHCRQIAAGRRFVKYTPCHTCGA